VTNITFRELLAASGMTIRQFAAYFDIPVRTVESWSSRNPNVKGRCAPYLIDLLHFKLVHDGIIDK
jgi:DNA-binding transcriptional regulator YiaG